MRPSWCRVRGAVAGAPQLSAGVTVRAQEQAGRSRRSRPIVGRTRQSQSSVARDKARLGSLLRSETSGHEPYDASLPITGVPVRLAGQRRGPIAASPRSVSQCTSSHPAGTAIRRGCSQLNPVTERAVVAGEAVNWSPAAAVYPKEGRPDRSRPGARRSRHPWRTASNDAHPEEGREMEHTTTHDPHGGGQHAHVHHQGHRQRRRPGCRTRQHHHLTLTRPACRAARAAMAVPPGAGSGTDSKMTQVGRARTESLGGQAAGCCPGWRVMVNKCPLIPVVSGPCAESVLTLARPAMPTAVVTEPRKGPDRSRC